MTQEIGPDPRFGMQAPVNQRMTITTPSGLRTDARGRAAPLSCSTPYDALSLRSLTETVDRQRPHAARRASTPPPGASPTARRPAGRRRPRSTPTAGRLRAEVPGIAPRSSTYDTRGRLTRTAQGTRTTSLHLRRSRARRRRSPTRSRGRPSSPTTSRDRIAAAAGDRTGARWRTATTAPATCCRSRRPGARRTRSRTPRATCWRRYTPPQSGPASPPTSYAADRDTLLTGGHAARRRRRSTFAYDAGGRLERMTQPRGSADFAYAAPSGQPHDGDRTGRGARSATATTAACRPAPRPAAPSPARSRQPTTPTCDSPPSRSTAGSRPPTTTTTTAC